MERDVSSTQAHAQWELPGQVSPALPPVSVEMETIWTVMVNANNSPSSVLLTLLGMASSVLELVTLALLELMLKVKDACLMLLARMVMCGMLPT